MIKLCRGSWTPLLLGDAFFQFGPCILDVRHGCRVLLLALTPFDPATSVDKWNRSQSSPAKRTYKVAEAGKRCLRASMLLYLCVRFTLA
jgi:hypothetical protein